MLQSKMRESDVDILNNLQRVEQRLNGIKYSGRPQTGRVLNADSAQGPSPIIESPPDLEQHLSPPT